jgi:predicted secreted protein with PEFG-CTERM motif
MNSRRYAVASIAIAFMAVTLLSVPGFGGNAYAAGTGMSLSADANYMSGKISVSGVTDRTHEPVTIQVTNSNGIHAIAQADTSSGNYSAALGVQDMDGSYTIIAQQGTGSGKYKLSVDISASNTSASTSSLISGEASTAAVTTSAPAGGLTISAADSVEGSTTINVSGTTDRGDDITLKVIAPNGNIVSVDQVTPSGGSYSATIGTGGSQFDQDGVYTITARQAAPSMYNVSAEIEIIDGHVIPEFGTIAAMILVVAIVAIVVVSAKSKLSLVQRF